MAIQNTVNVGGKQVAVNAPGVTQWSTPGSSAIPTSTAAPTATATPAAPAQAPTQTPPTTTAPNSQMDTPAVPGQTIDQTSTPANGQQAFELAKQSGQAPPVTPGAAATAVKSFTDAAAAAPSFYKPTTPVPGYDAQTVFDKNGKALSYEDYKAAGGKGVMGGGGWEDVQSGSPPPPPNAPQIIQQLAESPAHQKLMADQQLWMNTANQQKTLTDTYQQMIKDVGIPAIDEKLINAEAIINGTEDDIRKEVQAASGFATDSQVMALSSARNKSLIQNYNKLLSTKNMAMENIKTMVGLSEQDRQFALSTISQQIQFDQQNIDYGQKMQTAATEGYNKIIDKMGYKGLYDSLAHDPSSIATVEKSLGLHPGGLQALAATATTPAFKDMPTSYQEYTLAKQGGYTGTYNDYQTMDANRKAVKSTTNNITYNQKEADQVKVDTSTTANNLGSAVGKDGFVSPQDWKRAYSDWLSAGHAGADFVNNFKGYVNPADPEDYGVKL